MTMLRHGNRPLREPSALAHVLTAMIVLFVAIVALRLSTSIADKGPAWDEGVMLPIVQSIVRDGWHTANTIDYQDTKGPVFFWTYALFAEAVGDDVDRLRLVSLGLFLLTGIPLGLLAARVGLGLTQTLGVSVLYALFPYQAVLA